jgi:hypothetical protein
MCGALALALNCSKPTPADEKPRARGDDNDQNPAMNNPEKHAWQLFIKINRRANNGSGRDMIWETWITDADMFPKCPNPESPPPWPGAKIAKSGAKIRQKQLKRSMQVLLAHPQRAESLKKDEEIHRNRKEFDFIVHNKFWYREGLMEAFKNNQEIMFPLGAMAVKARWKPITDNDKPRYHWNLHAGQPVGLIALHISSKDLPNWFWATFEHVDNPDRGKDLGCHDSFGVEPKNSCDGKVSEALREMLRAAGLGPEWENYKLDGTQTDFTDHTGRPTLLGNSIIEGDQGVMRTSSCITCHSRAAMDGGGYFLFYEKLGALPEAFIPDGPAGYVGVPDPSWYFDPSGKRKTLQLGFTWGFLNTYSSSQP